MTLEPQGNIKVVLVDGNDNVLGEKEKFEAHKNPVPLHRAISVVIFDPKREKMLLQKRADGKPTWPLFWSNATCTHPYPNESYKEAAERRLKEEMGFKVPLKEIFRFIYKAEYDKNWGEHEYDVVFEGTYGGETKPDSNEVADYKWIGINDLLNDINANPENYSPWFKIILKKLKNLVFPFKNESDDF